MDRQEMEQMKVRATVEMEDGSRVQARGKHIIRRRDLGEQD